MCPQKTGSRVKRALARDDTVCSLVTLFRGWTAIPNGAMASAATVQAVAEPPLYHFTVASKDWIPGKPPQRGPRLPGMTQYVAWWTCFRGIFPPFHLYTFPPSKLLSSAFYNHFYHHRKERKQYSITFTKNNGNNLHNPS